MEVQRLEDHATSVVEAMVVDCSGAHVVFPIRTILKRRSSFELLRLPVGVIAMLGSTWGLLVNRRGLEGDLIGLRQCEMAHEWVFKGGHCQEGKPKR